MLHDRQVSIVFLKEGFDYEVVYLLDSSRFGGLQLESFVLKVVEAVLTVRHGEFQSRWFRVGPFVIVSPWCSAVHSLSLGLGLS